MAWNCRSNLAVVVEGDPGRTVAAVPAGTSRGTKRLGFEASTSLRGLASLCFRKLCMRAHTDTVSMCKKTTTTKAATSNQVLIPASDHKHAAPLRVIQSSFHHEQLHCLRRVPCQELDQRLPERTSSLVGEAGEAGWRTETKEVSRDGYICLICLEKDFGQRWCNTSMSMALSVFMTTSNKGFTRVWGAAGIRWKRLMMAEQIFISWTESERGRKWEKNKWASKKLWRQWSQTQTRLLMGSLAAWPL